MEIGWSSRDTATRMYDSLAFLQVLPNNKSFEFVGRSSSIKLLRSFANKRSNTNGFLSSNFFASRRYWVRFQMAVKTAVFVSGGGRSLENLLRYCDKGALEETQIVTVVSSKNGTKALEIAKNWSVPAQVVSPRNYPSNTEFSQALVDVCASYGVSLIVLAGWLHFFHIPPSFQGRVINIHPSLIPSFCGKGYYGMNVHKAVLDFGVKITGCTVHFADNEYDHGPIILQKAVDVLETDTVDTLSRRVFEAEKVALPEAIRLFSKGLLKLEGRRVKILKEALKETCVGDK
ncbi:phosphoribosylglycinamide formyltransferase [Galdieria sulphuraria]|uniref:phosphoribosylglycinamide formyltransferase 1 n=1 Tax=Galdieria sulphuraria TaxID=130081 RepID=M2Y0V2_GALSU|nr:phosphoribosylglycinamide formyltransferase [Galdieria sulphuraria]EME29558.1 phosphoribosylglycinamide formyltransferase [Galdieria sulphuraria]|eukprot:XP_005706078.1 phosphoribosylglycinamide formyltransferase [Galdieria sulphuraria]